METFYRLGEDIFAVLTPDGSAVSVTWFTSNFLVNINKTAPDIVANCPECPEALWIFDRVKNRQLIESSDGVDFYIDKESFKIGAIMDGIEIELDSPSSKEIIIKERKKMKDFIKSKKQSFESYKMGDRVLLYWPTGTGKTFNFISLMNLVLKALDPVDGENYYITNVLQGLKQIFLLLCLVFALLLYMSKL